MAEPALKSNIAQWQALQADGYFDKHPFYGPEGDASTFDCETIERFRPLTSDMTVVVIGCGYGRESVHIGRRVAHVYGIDVSDLILDRAVQHLRRSGVENFTPVLAERFAKDVPQGIDLVFSHVVFQHLTRDLARNYLEILAGKLSETGSMVIQFCEDFYVAPDNDAGEEIQEPSVSYSVRQILEAASPRLTLEQARSVIATPSALWHWAHLVRDPDYWARSEPPRFQGKPMINVDLKAVYQTYTDKLADQPGVGVGFSTGSTPWGYAAAIGLGIGGDVRAPSLDVVIKSEGDTVLLLVVDQAYNQVGERVIVQPRAGVQRCRVGLRPDAYALIVQAGAEPRNRPVMLEEVVLNNEG